MGNISLTLGATKGGAVASELDKADALLEVLKKDGGPEYDQLKTEFRNLSAAQKQQLEAVFAGDMLDAYGAGSYANEQSYLRDIVEEMSSA